MQTNVHIMALTATATRSLREEMTSLLGMISPYIIVRSPDKVNIRYTVMKIGSYDKFFQHILKELQIKRTFLPRIIIFCKHKADCGKLYTYFRVNMGRDFMEPPGTSEQLVQHRLVDMFFQGTDVEVKEQIIKNFTISSPLRIVISTVAFGMGVNCPDVHLVINLGPPSDIEMYVQEVGRGGRNGMPSYAVLLSSATLLQHCSKSMINYVHNDTACRRNVLFKEFDMFCQSPHNTGCKCCDICLKKCECTQCNNTLCSTYTFLPFMFGSK